MTEEEIKILTPSLKILGYLKRTFALAEYELKVKTKHQVFDGTWQNRVSIEERAAYKSLLDDCMPWWYALSSEELDSILVIERTLQSLTDNSYPFPKLYRIEPETDLGLLPQKYLTPDAVKV